MLLSPTSSFPVSATDSYRQPSGCSFPSFLATPLHAFILLLGFTSSDIETDMYNKADELLSLALNKWGSLLALMDNLNPVWAQSH